ncbi:hypothetical protein [Porphyromonas gingivalis]|uniref:hypothetical protein n=1 Tax=Porphyromonas gingivalis TaxID=837 RepID=UPI000C179883|nr:hypothetical protein [Porphyromonas gingivalis]ATR99237.1 hypothetical protein CS550_08735 [Porphyromonas gingivalis]
MGAETGVSGLMHRCNEQETAYNRVLHPCREQETVYNHSLNLCVRCRHGRMGGSVIGIDEKQVSYGQSDGG